MHGLVLAGGEGSRLAADGVAAPKALVPVGGRPQLLRLVAEFEGRPPVHLSTLTDVIPTKANAEAKAGRPTPRSAAKTRAPAPQASAPKRATG